MGQPWFFVSFRGHYTGRGGTAGAARRGQPNFELFHLAVSIGESTALGDQWRSEANLVRIIGVCWEPLSNRRAKTALVRAIH